VDTRRFLFLLAVIFVASLSGFKFVPWIVNHLTLSLAGAACACLILMGIVTLRSTTGSFDTIARAAGMKPVMRLYGPPAFEASQKGISVRIEIRPFGREWRKSDSYWIAEVKMGVRSARGLKFLIGTPTLLDSEAGRLAGSLPELNVIQPWLGEKPTFGKPESSVHEFMARAQPLSDFMDAGWAWETFSARSGRICVQVMGKEFDAERLKALLDVSVRLALSLEAR